MAFLIHALSVSATGREIRRTRRIEEDRLTIGRDPRCDIVLPDLEVTLHHAAIIRTGQRRCFVQSTCGIPFSIDGRSTQASEIDADTGAEVRIGGFRLEINWDDEAQAIAILVERFALLARSTETQDERRLFSLAAVAPSRRAIAWAAAALVLLMFLAWPIWTYHRATAARLSPEQITAVSYHGDRSWSAGPLSAAHATLSHNCTACHVKAFVAVTDDTCRTCHRTVHDHADPARLRAALAPLGLGPRLRFAVAQAFGRPAGRCADCHTEHKGAAAMMPPSQQFCADCHANLRAKLPDTTLASASDFGREHPQFQPAIMITPGKRPLFRRASLDDHPRQNTGLTFPHDSHVSQTGGVARMAQTMGLAHGSGGLGCESCHKPDPTSGGFRPITMEEDCQGCHSLAFARTNGIVRTLRHGDAAQAIAELTDYYAMSRSGPALPMTLGRRRPGDFGGIGLTAIPPAAPPAARAAHALFGRGGACSDCHAIIAPAHAGGLDYRISPVTLPDHYLTRGWFDHRSHATEPCATCHAAAARSRDARDVMIPGIATCRQCHVGEQGGGVFAAGPKRVLSNCAMCHVYHRDPNRAATADRRRHTAGDAALFAPAGGQEGG